MKKFIFRRFRLDGGLVRRIVSSIRLDGGLVRRLELAGQVRPLNGSHSLNVGSFYSSLFLSEAS
jgi:hypothetical protein